MIEGMNSNATLNWSANVALSEGENTITVVATDGGAHHGCGGHGALRTT